MFLYYHHAFPDTFLVIEEGTMLGYIIFTPNGHVISLAVDPAHRRKGIGTRLMNTCGSQFKISRLWVEVRESNIGAHKFYEKLGFQLKSKICLYYGTEDAYVMEKKYYVWQSRPARPITFQPLSYACLVSLRITIWFFSEGASSALSFHDDHESIKL
jgi:ribosomal-protein-alanine N-acetyltransferase